MLTNYEPVFNHAGQVVVHEPGVSIEQQLRTRLSGD